MGTEGAMQFVGRVAGAAAICLLLALLAMWHHRLFGLRPPTYLDLATMLLMVAVALLVRGDHTP